MKKISLMLVMMLSVITMNLDAAITVRCKIADAGWERVSLWAWTSEGNVFDSWPGEELTESDGWYSYTFADEITSVSYMFANTDNADFKTTEILDVTADRCWSITSSEGGTAAELDCTTSELLDDEPIVVSPDKMVIRAHKPEGWSKMMIWAWDDSNNYTGGVWPGVEMTDNDNDWFCFELPAGTSFIFNNGEGTQTENIEGVSESTCYNLEADGNYAVTTDCPNSECENGEIDEPIKEEVTVTLIVKAPESWDVVNIYAWGDSEFYGTWVGTALTLVDGYYTITSTFPSSNYHLILNNGTQQVDVPALETACYELTVTGEGQHDVSIAEMTCPDIDTSIEGIEGSAVRIYPNPAQDILTVEAQNVRSINIFNVAGQNILSTTEKSISVEHFATGMYIISVETKDGLNVMNFLKK